MRLAYLIIHKLFPFFFQRPSGYFMAPVLLGLDQNWKRVNLPRYSSLKTCYWLLLHKLHEFYNCVFNLGMLFLYSIVVKDQLVNNHSCCSNSSNMTLPRPIHIGKMITASSSGLSHIFLDIWQTQSCCFNPCFIWNRSNCC